MENPKHVLGHTSEFSVQFRPLSYIFLSQSIRIPFFSKSLRNTVLKFMLQVYPHKTAAFLQFRCNTVEFMLS